MSAEPSEGRERARQEWAKKFNFGSMRPEGDGWCWDFEPDQKALVAYEEAFQAGRRPLEQERWISVEERLPESEWVLVIGRTGGRVGVSNNCNADGTFRARFTYWMPLPAPPVPKGDS